VVKDKYKDKSLPLQIFHNYTGYLAVVFVLLTIASVFMVYVDSLPFFESWTCEKLNYFNINDSRFNNPDNKILSEFTEAEIKRLHQLYDECKIVYG
jgi:ABC-type phosphate transport system permease subunit